MSHVTALVLAAGSSRRMGAENKLLLPFKGKPVISHVVDNLKASQVQDILVVTGYEAEKISKMAECSVIHNPDHQQGMGTSIVAGVKGISEKTDAVLICLADMPLITSDIIDQVIAGFDPAAGKTIVVPENDGCTGHPVLFGRDFFKDLKDLKNNRGARDIIHSNALQHLKKVSIPNSAIFRDLDKPDDYENLRNFE